MPKLALPFRALTVVTLTALASWGLLGGCSSNGNPCGDEYTTRVNDDADFESYQTFAVMDIPEEGGLGGAGGAGGGELPDDIRVNLELANEAAAESLELKGLERVDADDDPDLLVFSASASEEETGIYWYCVPGWYWWGWYYYWDPCAWMAPIEFEYTVGTLLVGVLDPVLGEPAFGGLIQGILECTSEDLEDRIEDGVADVFDDYPAPEE